MPEPKRKPKRAQGHAHGDGGASEAEQHKTGHVDPMPKIERNFKRGNDIGKGHTDLGGRPKI